MATPLAIAIGHQTVHSIGANAMRLCLHSLLECVGREGSSGHGIPYGLQTRPSKVVAVVRPPIGVDSQVPTFNNSAICFR